MKRIGYSKIQTCVLQATQQLEYSYMKSAQVLVILNVVNGQDVFANLFADWQTHLVL